MPMLFEDTSLPVNIAVFVVAAIVVWIAGTRMADYADTISRKTGLGHALAGLILLAAVTSLPEIGVTASASLAGNGPLAVNNLFGSVAMQVAVLAVVDFAIGRRALTSVVPDPSVLLLGALNVLLLGIAALGMIAGDVAFLNIGLWAWACLLAYVFCVWVLSQSTKRRPWQPALSGDPRLDERDLPASHGAADGRGPVPRRVIVAVVIAATAILVAGSMLAQTGEAIARQTGLGASFVGFVLLATSTSLPEFSTALAAARAGHFTMAISDILGTNMINVGLLFLVDALAGGDPVLNTTDGFAVFGAVLGIVVTALFLAGLAERRDLTVARMGIDSIAVFVVYLGGLILLYGMR